MVFKKKADLNGQIDPRINTEGRIKGIKDKSRREIKEGEILSLLRKIKPHIAESVMTASRIMKNPEAADANKLKSAALLIGLYKDLLKDAYEGGDEEQEGVEIQPPAQAVFSLKMIDSKDKD